MIDLNAKPAGVSEAFWRSAVTRRWTAEDCARRTRLPVDVFACAGRPREVVSDAPATAPPVERDHAPAKRVGRSRSVMPAIEKPSERALRAEAMDRNGVPRRIIAERLGYNVQSLGTAIGRARNWQRVSP